MEPGKPIIGVDTVVFLERAEDILGGKATVELQIEKEDVSGLLYVYIIRNNAVKKMLGRIDLGIHQTNNNILTYSYELTRAEYYDKFRGTYPVFKFRIESADDSKVFTESNEFKIVLS